MPPLWPHLLGRSASRFTAVPQLKVFPAPFPPQLGAQPLTYTVTVLPGASVSARFNSFTGVPMTPPPVTGRGACASAPACSLLDTYYSPVTWGSTDATLTAGSLRIQCLPAPACLRDGGYASMYFNVYITTGTREGGLVDFRGALICRDGQRQGMLVPCPVVDVFRRNMNPVTVALN